MNAIQKQTLIALDAILLLAEKLAINVARVIDMRAANEDGHLSDADVDQLAADAEAAVGRLHEDDDPV